MARACTPLIWCILLAAVILLLIIGREYKAESFAPAPTNTSYYLRGDGTWAVTNMTGASAATSTAPAAPGSAGAVPQPLATDTENYLRGDGTWAGIPNIHQYLYIAGSGVFSPPAGTAAGVAVPVVFSGTPTIRGATITANAALTQFTIKSNSTTPLVYKIEFGYAMINGASTGTYTPPAYTITNVTVPATPVAISTPMVAIPIPVSYGKYYMGVGTAYAYATIPPSASIVISVMLTAAPTDIMVNPRLSIELA